jgi:hypothetical protein
MLELADPVWQISMRDLAYGAVAQYVRMEAQLIISPRLYNMSVGQSSGFPLSLCDWVTRNTGTNQESETYVPLVAGNCGRGRGVLPSLAGPGEQS